jgi:hypothetical protein
MMVIQLNHGRYYGKWARTLSIMSLLAIAGCGAQNINQFANGAPSMAPHDWMSGTVDGYGVIRDRFGNVKSQFHAHETGVWDAATLRLTLTERITYLQGSTQPPTDRVWHFAEISPGHWTGSAADIIGTAQAEQQGNAWHLTYAQNLPVGGHQLAVHVDDWRFREADQVAVDTATISKLGVTLANSSIAFVKQSNEENQQ